MTFTENLWQGTAPVYQAILRHDFIQELQAGTLSKAVFQFYIQQDALYLADFGRALSIVGGKAPTSVRMLDFARFAEGAVVVEQALHQDYFQQFGASGKVEKSPACFSYTNFLLATVALEPYEVGVAALLPCFWIYREVGLHIIAGAAPHNFYQAWIDTYAGEEFSALVDKAIAITDEAAQRASKAEQQAMQRAYRYAAHMEWLFWDSAYRQEKWLP
jgi:thiaminase/transcriptional activator TenA